MSVADGGPVDLPEGMKRADAILAGMPLLFVGGYGVAAAAVNGWAVPTATAALACALLMFDGIVRNPPRSR
jgi:ABC-type transport system involved in cytochrome bd biosynthesis fused ATPase/permease subunit